MNDNSKTNQTSFSHPNYGENFYVPPPIHHNKYELDSISTQTSHIESDALQAQRAAENDQAGMVSPSVPQQKPTKEYVIHYHQPGEEFAPPSQSQSNETTTTTTQVHQPGMYVPIFAQKRRPGT